MEAAFWDEGTVVGECRDAVYLRQRRYVGQCDGAWEHGYRVQVKQQRRASDVRSLAERQLDERFDVETLQPAPLTR